MPLAAEGWGISRLRPDCSTRMSFAGRCGCRCGSARPASLESITLLMTSRLLLAVPIGDMACNTPRTRPRDSGESGVSPPQAPYAGLRRGCRVSWAVTRAAGSLGPGGAAPAPAAAAQVRQRRYDQVTRVSTHPADPPGQAGTAELPRVPDLVIHNGPVEWVMSRVIRKLAWSRLSDPMVALTLSGA